MEKTISRIQSIQFLRGVGCLCVVLSHTKYVSGGGQTGVDLFLVISGFVMMYSTERSTEHFWKRRLRKIMPLYWGVTMFTSLLVLVMPWLFNSYEVSLEYFYKSMLLIPYYHSGLSGPIVALGWTLYYEMVFYLIFWVALKINYVKRGVISAGICIVLVLSGKLFLLPMPFSFWAEPVILEFVYGILIYYIYNYYMTHFERLEKKEITRRSVVGYSVASYFVLALGIWAMEYFINIDGFNRAYGTGICAAFILCWFLLLEGKISLPKWLIHIGNISYPIYLLHIFPVRFIDMVLGKFFASNILISLIGVAGAVITTEILIRLYQLFSINLKRGNAVSRKSL